MLTGEELLAKVKEMGGASKSEVVKACGYVSQKKDGSDRLNFTAFYEALLEAKGVGIGSGGGVGKGGVENQLVVDGSPDSVLIADDLGMLMLHIHELRTILWTDRRRFSSDVLRSVAEDLAELAGERGK